MYTLVNGTHWNTKKYDCYLGPTDTTYVEDIKWDRFWADPFYKHNPIETQESMLTLDLLISTTENNLFGDVYNWENVILNLEKYGAVSFPIISRLLKIDNGIALTVHMLGQLTNGINLLMGVHPGFERIGKNRPQRDLYEENYNKLINYLEQKLQQEAYILAMEYFIPILQQQKIEFAPNYTLTPLNLADPRFNGRDRFEYANFIGSNGGVEIQTIKFKASEDDEKIYDGGIYYYQPFEFTWPEN